MGPGLRLLEAFEKAKCGVLPERAAGHPRVFLREADVCALKDRAHGPLRDDWLAVQADVVARPQLEPAALCALITGDPFHLGLAREHIRRLLEEPEWAGSPYSPQQNRDLKTGRSLVSLSTAYDLLYHHLTPGERDGIRAQLARNCRLAFAHYVEPDRKWEYAQNHPYLPMVGMALAGYALYGEEPEAGAWIRLAETFMDRTLRCNGADGWYYEGWGYWRWAVPFLAIYAEAHYRMTGRMDALEQPLIRNLATYVRYMLMPGGQEAFDFGDTYPMYVPDYVRHNRKPYETEWAGVPWRATVSLSGGREGFVEDPRGFCPLETLDLVAARFQDGHAQFLGTYLRTRGVHRRFWSLLWRDPGLQEALPDRLPGGHYFPDHEVAVWRSGWQEHAAAVAIKCGPPAGHANAGRLQEYPDFRMQAWHAHPDAGSFILWAHGQFLCTDTGYSHPKRTMDHNCLLINGRGQEEDHAAFNGVPYDRLDRIHLKRVDIRPECMYAVADMAAAYPPDLEMDRVERRLVVANGCILVWDLLDSAYPHDYAWLLHTDTDYEKANEGYRTRKGDAALLVRFVHPRDVKVRVAKTVVIAHQWAPRGSGPPQERGHHLEAHQRGGQCQYAACLTWGWRHEPAPVLDGRLEDGRLSVSLAADGACTRIWVTEEGASVSREATG